MVKHRSFAKHLALQRMNASRLEATVVLIFIEVGSEMSPLTTGTSGS